MQVSCWMQDAGPFCRITPRTSRQNCIPALYCLLIQLTKFPRDSTTGFIKRNRNSLRTGSTQQTTLFLSQSQVISKMNQSVLRRLLSRFLSPRTRFYIHQHLTAKHYQKDFLLFMPFRQPVIPYKLWQSGHQPHSRLP